MTTLKLHFTEHALGRMAKRQLQQAWVERVIADPARIEPDADDAALEHRLGAVPELAGRVGESSVCISTEQ